MEFELTDADQALLQQRIEAVMARVACDDVDLRDIPACEATKRMLEVAAVGGHPVRLHSVGTYVGYDNHGAPIECRLTPARRERNETIVDALLRATAVLGVRVAEPGDLALQIEVHVSDVDLVLSPPDETTSDVLLRVEAARLQPDPTVPKVGGAVILLGEAARRGIGPSREQHQFVWAVAASVARLDEHKVISRRDVAETLSYLADM